MHQRNNFVLNDTHLIKKKLPLEQQKTKSDVATPIHEVGKSQENKEGVPTGSNIDS